MTSEKILFPEGQPQLDTFSLFPFLSLPYPIPIESRCQVSRHAGGLHGPWENLKDLCCSTALIWPTECPRYSADGIDGPPQRSKMKGSWLCAQFLASGIGSFSDLVDVAFLGCRCAWTLNIIIHHPFPN